MRNESLTKIGVVVLSFTISMAAGFYLTKWIMPQPQQPPQTDEIAEVDSINVEELIDTTATIDTTDIGPVVPEPIPTPKPIQKISKGMLTKIINDPNNQNYPRNVKLIYDNLDPSRNEEYQASISNLRSYIKSGVWKSVTVTGVTYDEATGNVTSITMTINRNSEE